MKGVERIVRRMEYILMEEREITENLPFKLPISSAEELAELENFMKEAGNYQTLKKIYSEAQS